MRIELKNIHKHFGDVRANDGISFSIHQGSIHVVIGENGAGKSTLMKILSGYNRKTKGSILINGNLTEFITPSDASGIGIGM